MNFQESLSSSEKSETETLKLLLTIAAYDITGAFGENESL
jgi:hypothetical protein